MLHFQSNNKRLLEVYAADAHNPLYLEQLKLLKQDEPGLQDRDLVVTSYVKDAGNAARFKQKHITGDFSIILIGKDGGEKFRSTTPVNTKKLYSIIDVMPMRKEEMKAKSGK